MEIFKFVAFVLCCTADVLAASVDGLFASDAMLPLASTNKCKLVLFAGPKESSKIIFPFSVDGFDRLFRDENYDPNKDTVFLVDLNGKQTEANMKIMRNESENRNLILVDLTPLAPLVDSLQADINESTIGQDLLPMIGAELPLGEILAVKVSHSLGAQVMGQIVQGIIIPVTGHDPTPTGPFFSILSVNAHVANKKYMKGKFWKKSY